MASVSPSRLHAACTFATCTPCTTVVYHSALGPIRIQAVRTCAVTNTSCSLAVLCRTRSFAGDNFNAETVREIVGSFVDDSALPAAPPRKQPNKPECPSCCVRHIAWCTVLGGFAFISHAAPLRPRMLRAWRRGAARSGEPRPRCEVLGRATHEGALRRADVGVPWRTARGRQLRRRLAGPQGLRLLPQRRGAPAQASRAVPAVFVCTFECIAPSIPPRTWSVLCRHVVSTVVATCVASTSLEKNRRPRASVYKAAALHAALGRQRAAEIGCDPCSVVA